jgi:hypothetical protein
MLVMVVVMSMVLMVVGSVSRARAETKSGATNQQRTSQQK